MATRSRRVRGEREPLGVHRDEVPPVVGALVDRPEDLDDAGFVLGVGDELLERGHDLAQRGGARLLGRAQLDDGLVLVDRRATLPEPVLEEPAELEPEPGLVLGQRALLRASPRQVREVLPPLPRA